MADPDEVQARVMRTEHLAAPEAHASDISFDGVVTHGMTEAKGALACIEGKEVGQHIRPEKPA